MDCLHKLKEIPNVKAGVSLRVHRTRFTTRRSWLKRSLGVHYKTAALPFNDVRDQLSQVRGVCRRILIKTPEVDKTQIARFRSFVRMYLRTEARRHGLLPLDETQMLDMESWLATTGYPEWRKKELREAQRQVHEGVSTDKLFLCKCFGKVEALEGAKENRIINARVDYAKVTFGPAIKSIEQRVYACIPEFVKHIPICEYPAHILEMCSPAPGERVIATDYTSFEGHFAPEMIRVCECALYRYMLGHRWSELSGQMTEVLSGNNVCQSPLVSYSVRGCRMSGDMCTSLGNGFTNLMIIKFLAWEMKSKVRGFVEGDDGIFAITGEVPSPQQYAELGFNIKIDVVDRPEVASFCGQVFSAETKEIVVDPLYVMLNVGWTSSDQRHGTEATMRRLLRAKAISLAYQCPRCPIINSLCRALLRLTRGVAPKFPTFGGLRDWWEMRKIGPVSVLSDEVGSRLALGPDASLRGVVAEVYGWQPHEQIELEKFFDSWTKIEPWSHPTVDGKIPVDYSDYAREHTVEFSRGSDVRRPWSSDYDFTTNLDVRGLGFSTKGDDPDESIARHVFSATHLYGRMAEAPVV